MSRRVLAVVEGQTESSVLNSVLAPHLGARGVYLAPKVVGKPGHKGGVRSFDDVSKEIANLFKQEPKAVVTTFFDFYGLPETWPGVKGAKNAKTTGVSILQAVQSMERELHATITKRVSALSTPAQFIPYVQIYELEALLFAGPKQMAEVFLQPSLESDFAQIVKNCGGCEQIDDHPHSAPSKRIQDLFPRYRKGRDRNRPEDQRPHAPIIVQRIGLAPIRNACPHFSQWVTRLEDLGSDSSTLE